MKATLKGFAAGGLAVGITAVALQFSTPAQAFTTGSYDLLNHPDALLNQDPVPVAERSGPYGLRLDNLCWHLNCGTYTSNDEKTFSAESAGASTLWLDWGLDGDLTTARIHGTVTYNDQNTTKPALQGPVWTVEYNLTHIEAIDGSDPTNGWRVAACDPSTQDAATCYDSTDPDYWVTGTMTNGTGANETVISLRGKNDGSGYAFIFDDDGHRCGGHGAPCEAGAIEARGWMISTTGDPNDPNAYWKNKGSNDWLLVAQHKPGNGGGDDIPEPATLALFGAGLIGVRLARRRRSR